MWFLALKKSLKTSLIVEPPLVTCPISHGSIVDACYSFDVYPVSVKVNRPPALHLKDNVAPDRSSTTLHGFSKKSRSRLRFIAANSASHITSQFCMTYADYWPINGRECKRHLNLFLNDLRLKFSSVKYIWIGEFQTRGAPHFHLFTDLAVTFDNQARLSNIWHRVAGVSQRKHLAVHTHAKNFIPWDMGNGSYLCKYLDKEHQKHIPKGFGSFGRWWGNSSNLKPVADTVSVSELDLFLSDAYNAQTGELYTDSVPQYLIRTLVKYQSKNNKSKWAIKRSQSMTVLTGASVFNQSLEYLERQAKRRFL